MANSSNHISEQLFKIIKGFGHTVILYDADGKKTIDPADARRFYAKDIQMMVNYNHDENTNEIVVNLSKDTDIKEVSLMLSSIRTLASRYITEYTVKTFGKSISPKDFAYQAKTTVEEEIGMNEIPQNTVNPQSYKKDTIIAFLNNWKQQRKINDAQFNALAQQISRMSKSGKITTVALNTKLSSSRHIDSHAFFQGLNHFIKKHNTQAGTDITDANLDERNQENKDDKNVYQRKLGHANRHKLSKKKHKINRRDAKQMTDIEIGRHLNRSSVYDSDLKEGFSGWHGSARKSVNELGNARMVIRHKRAVDEEKRGARTRQVESIFIENAAGERFKFPNRNITAAKAMVKHVKEGGTPFDDFGQHIYSVMEELEQLKKFQRYNRRNDFFENEQEISEEITGRVTSLRSTLKQMSGPKGYTRHFESFAKSNGDAVSEEQLNELRDAVTVRYFDEAISESLPYVAKVIEAFRTRQDKESEIITFVRYVMQHKDEITLNRPLDIDNPEGPAARRFRDPATEVAAWVNYLAPYLKDDTLANLLMQVSDTAFEVSPKHVNLAQQAINVIQQNARVAESAQTSNPTRTITDQDMQPACAGGKETAIDDAEIAHINETFDKYNVRKIFNV